MSKIVTIPNCSNPFVVIVNGVEYSYPAGQTVEVPDFIAAVIENHVNSHPQPVPPVPGGSGGSSVQSDWNQTDDTQPDFIRNKPFGEGLAYGDTLYVKQIAPEAIDPSLLVGDMLYKVSNSAPTMEYFLNGCLISFMGGANYYPPETMQEICVQVVDGLVAVGGFLFSVEEQAVGVEFEELDGAAFPESGFYVPAEALLDGDFTLTINGYTDFPNVKKLDNKYLPDAPKFYYSETNKRIYNDANLIIMTTRADILPYLKQQFIVVFPVEGIDAITYFPVAASDNGAYVLVGIQDASGYKAIYTAERTE